MRVIVFNVPTSGHVIPTLPLANELVRRGHEVTYFLNAIYRDRIAATGAEYRPLPDYPDVEMGPPNGQFNPPLLVNQLLEASDSLLPALVAALKADPPDVVVTDSMCPWGRLAADLAGVPVVSSMVLLTLNPALMFAAGVWREAVTGMVRFLPDMARMLRRIRSFNHKHAVKLPSLADLLNWPADLNICYTSAEIQPDAAALGETYRFVGPILDSRPRESDFPLDQLDATRPLIYISLGSVFSDNPSFYRTALDAFAAEPVQIVLSTGRKVSPTELGAIPANAIVRAWVPQLEVLQRADLFVTHAGMGSVHEGLGLGVPLLLVPQQLEQALVATRLAALGAGVKVSAVVSAESLRRTANHILNTPTYLASVAQLRTSLNAGGGAVSAVDAIEAFTARR